MIVAIHLMLAASCVPAVEHALEALLGEPWQGQIAHGPPRPRPTVDEAGEVVWLQQPDPYPGAALLSWQGAIETAAAIVAAVGEVDPSAYLGRGVALGLEDDDRVELGSYDPPRPLDLLDPRESPALLYERWLAARS